MGKNLSIVLLVLLMVAVVVGVDLAFFRHRFWARLIANVAIVVTFGAIYLLVARRS
jgi:uncharacterized membrane protein YozB (DUF420 family)